MIMWLREKKKDLLKSVLGKFLGKYWLVIVFSVLLITAVVFAWNLFDNYVSVFGSFAPTPSISTTQPNSATRTEFGVTGDFFGGILNPIFSMLGLFMLLVTLFQNQRELQLSRKELKKSNKALTGQAMTLEKQRFEDTFFSLLDQLNQSLYKITTDGVRYKLDGLPATSPSPVDALKTQLIGSTFMGMEFCAELKAAKEILLKKDPLVNQYFRVLYQILKLVASSSPGGALGGVFSITSLQNTKASDSEKFYSNIVRAFVPEDVYYLLAINCYTATDDDQFYKYKLLVERYAFLEHMPLDLQKHQNRTLVSKMMGHYSAVAFGSNSDYLRLMQARK